MNVQSLLLNSTGNQLTRMFACVAVTLVLACGCTTDSAEHHSASNENDSSVIKDRIKDIVKEKVNEHAKESVRDIVEEKVNRVAGEYFKTSYTGNKDQQAYERGIKLINAVKYQQAIKVLTPAAKNGDAKCMYGLYVCYSNFDVSANKSKSDHWKQKAMSGLEKLAAENDVDALYYLGWNEHFSGSQTKGRTYIQKALPKLVKRAENGNSNDQSRLGAIYYFGIGATKNLNKSYRWYLKAAEQNNADANYMLGWMYEYGQGTTSNTLLAKSYYQSAAELGYGPAEGEYGRMLYHGGSAAEKRQALKYLASAVAKGDKNAKSYIAKINKAVEIAKSPKSFAKQVSRAVGESIMKQIGGGQDLVVSVQGIDYDSQLEEYEIDILVSFNGAIIRSDNYRVAGRITVNSDGSNARFARTAANEKYKEWESLIVAAKIGVEVADALNDASNDK